MATAPPTFAYVEEGQTVPLVLSDPDVVIEEVVRPKHEGGAGNWYCVVHREGFASNIGMSSHNEQPGSHIWAWICFEHGPEVP